MINTITYPTTTEFLRPELYLALATIVHEVLTYPLDRWGVRSMGTTQNRTHKSFLNYKETYLIALDVYQIEGKTGLYLGLRASLEKNLTKQIIRYFAFQFLYFKYAQRDYITRNYQPELEKDFQYTPGNPQVYPLLKYINYLELKVILLAALCNGIGVIASQPANILKIKIQSERLGDKISIYTSYKMKMKNLIKFHKNPAIQITPGLKYRFMYTFIQFVGENATFQYCLRKDGHQFMNVYVNRQNAYPNSSILKPICYGIMSSFIWTTITHPIYMLENREVINRLQNNPYNFQYLLKSLYNNEGLNGLTKGYLPNLIRSLSRNIILIPLMWNTASEYNKERFNPLYE